MSSHRLDPWSMLDHVAVGVVVHERAGQVVYVNQAACTLLGDERDRLLMRGAREGWSITAEDGSTLSPEQVPATRALHTGEPVRDQLLAAARPDGSRVWLLVTAIPVGEGEDRHVVVTFTDATVEHARLEREQTAHLQSELRHDAVLRAMSEGVAIHDATGKIIFTNPGAERILGLTQAQLLGREAVDPRWRLVCEDGEPLPLDEIPSEIATKTGRNTTRTLGVERGDGSRAWLSVSADCVAGEGDPSQGVVATFTNITELREAKVEAQNLAERLRSVTEAAPGVIYQYVVTDDGDAHFAFAAGRTKEVFGYTELELQTDYARAWAHVHPADQRRILLEIARSRATLSAFDLEARSNDGPDRRWIRFRSLPTRIPGGTRWTGFALDVTEERKLSDALRTGQRREAMGDLAAGIAHNFNNVLAVILPNIAAAREVAPAAEPYLADAAIATQRAVDLVKQILYIARGATPTEMDAVDLVVVIEEVVELCRRTFDRAIRLETRFGPRRAFTHGSPAHLQQVILNLCLNARDALGQADSPAITIALETIDEPLGTASSFHRVTVRDNGSGMSEETRKRLGELFFTTKGPGQGTGLGLATVFGTMREVNGSIEVESALGTGTTFDLGFPAVAGPSPGTVRPAAMKVSSREREILIVDDEPLVRRALGRTLRRVGHRVREVGSGREAIDVVSRPHTLDLVLLDLSMPEMSGAETLRWLREKEPTLPIIVLTGDATPREGLEMADAMLEKPVALPLLLEMFERLSP
ncbi:MAG: PAS domain S-box protein [Labilithrix sp.]